MKRENGAEYTLKSLAVSNVHITYIILFLALLERVMSSQASCAQNSGCAPLKLSGNCCPASNGKNLGCCSSTEPSASTLCVNSFGCSATNLTIGSCCPTSTGVYLDCCSIKASDPPTFSPSPKLTNLALCTNNAGCAPLGLTGLCCPAATGSNLGCCAPPSTPDSALCTNNSLCAHLHLEGDCCPTANGNFLDCCPKPTRSPVQPVTRETSLLQFACFFAGYSALAVAATGIVYTIYCYDSTASDDELLLQTQGDGSHPTSYYGSQSTSDADIEIVTSLIK